MKQAIIVIGIGEIGSILARGFLRLGHPVFPAVRNTDLDQLAKDISDPALVIVAVGEADLQNNLASLPDIWRDRVVLLQNELLPSSWEGHKLADPTIISIWFEKKKGQDSKVLIPSPAHGKHAQLVYDALATLDIPVRVLSSEQELLFELVVKNLYIVTTNVAGLKVGGNVGTLQSEHEAFMLEVAKDVLAIQESLTGSSFDQDKLFLAMREAMDVDPEHKCMGRSAPARLKRALQQADEANIDVPTLKAIAQLTS